MTNSKLYEFHHNWTQENSTLKKEKLVSTQDQLPPILQTAGVFAAHFSGAAGVLK